MEGSIEIAVCGTVGVIGSDGTPVAVPGRQPAVVLTVLALDNRRISHAALADILWGDRPGEHWSGALRGLFVKIRRILETAGHPPELLRSHQGSVGFDAPVVTELDRVEPLLRALHDHPEPDRVQKITDLADQLRQPFLHHHEGDWADSQRYRIAAIRQDLDHRLLRDMAGFGLSDRAILRARHLLSLDPIDETVHRLLIDLLLDEGRASDARDAHRAFEEMLAAEYGLTPDPRLRDRVLAMTEGLADFPSLPPRAHHPHAAEPFVGRTDEITRIHGIWTRIVETGSPEVVTLIGGSGTGKTRLADRVVNQLGGARVLWGRAPQVGGRVFGPVAEAIADLLERDPPFAERVRRDIPDLSNLVHGSPSRGDHTPDGDDGIDGRRRALAAARRFLRDVTTRPTVLVIDDLQWSGPDGLGVLEDLATTATGPLLLLVTTREPPADTARTLAEIDRSIPVTRIPIGTLDRSGLAELWTAARSEAPSPTDLDRFVERTGGLPFHASELLRDPDGDLPDPTTIPSSIEHWLDHHLGSLGDDERDLLETIAVFGTEVDPGDLERLTGFDPDRTAAACDRLITAGLLRPTPTGTVEIPHDLTVTAVHDRIGSTRRALLHRRIGDLLGDRLGEHPERADLVAHHWSLAGPSRTDEAVAAHLRAGEDALDQGAFETARTHLLTVRGRGRHPHERVRALIGLGRIDLQRNRHVDAQATLQQAIELARDHDLVDEVARATLLLVGRAGRGAALVDDRVHTVWLRDARRLLEARADTLDPDDPEARRLALLTSRIERELGLSILFDDVDGSADLLRSSVDRVSNLPDPPIEDLAASILAMRPIQTAGPDVHGRLADLDRVLSLPRAGLGPEVSIAAHVYRHEDLLRIGRPLAAAQDLLVARRLADRRGHAYWTWAIDTWEALALVLDGELEAGEEAVARAAASRAGVLGATACEQVNLVNIRLLQGRADEIVDSLAAAVEFFPQVPAYRAVLALVAGEIGDHRRARRILEELEPDRFAALPHDSNRFLALGVLAHTAADLGHERSAAVLLDLLEPFADQLVLLNCYGGGGASWGPTAWALARLAPLAGRDEDAARWWGQAVRMVEVTPVLGERVLTAAEPHRVD